MEYFIIQIISSNPNDIKNKIYAKVQSFGKGVSAEKHPNGCSV